MRTVWSPGKNGTFRLLGGLFHSHVFAPVITRASLARMGELLRDGKQDNVLLEWMLALELKRLGKISSIIPVFEVRALFEGEKRDIIKKLDGVSVETNAACIRFLRDLGIPHGDFNQTRINACKASEVYTNVCRFQATHGRHNGAACHPHQRVLHGLEGAFPVRGRVS